jgi:hypothetical protein
VCLSIFFFYIQTIHSIPYNYISELQVDPFKFWRKFVFLYFFL